MSIKTYLINSAQAQYTDEEFSFLQKFFIEQGLIADKEGVLGLQVSEHTAPNMSIDISIGDALVETTRNTITWKVIASSNTLVNLAIANNNTGNDRIDAVILRVSRSVVPNSLKNNIATLQVIIGNSASPLSDGDITSTIDGDDFLRLADIIVSDSATDITNSDIDNVAKQAKTNEAISLSPKNINFTMVDTDPVNPVEGQVWFNSSSHSLCFFDGSVIKVLGSTEALTAYDVYQERKDEQTTADTNTKFGETDATGKVFKKYQTFTPDFNLLGKISLKKGRYLTPFSAVDNLAFYNFNNDLTDSLSKSGNLTGAGSVSFGTDAFGRTNHSRVYGASGYGKDTATLGASISGAFTLETRFTRTATSLSQQNASIVEVGNYGANNGFGIWINYHNTNPINGVPPYGIHLRINQQHQGNQALMKTTYVAPLNVPVKYRFTYNGSRIKLFKKEQGIDKDWVNILDNPWTTNPASANTLSIGCRGENTIEYVIGKVDYVAITNSATSQIFTEEKTNSNISADMYLDNAGVPTGSSLGTATITKAYFDAVNEEQDFDLSFTTPIAITPNTTYGFLLSQATPSNTVYPQIRKGDAISTLGVLKNNNTTGGYTSDTGNLYAKILESGVNKMIGLNDNEEIPAKFIEKNYFGDGSDGDVVISSNTTLTRDMYYNNLTINSGITLTTGNFKIYVKGTLAGSGTISADGLGQQRMSGLPTDMYGGGIGGGGIAVQNIGTLKNNLIYNLFLNCISFTIPTMQLGGTRGGGNTADYGSSTTNHGGGCCFICANNITFTGLFSSKGNDAGAFSTGGGGGVVIIIYRTNTLSYTSSVLGGVASVNGSEGNVYQIQV